MQTRRRFLKTVLAAAVAAGGAGFYGAVQQALAMSPKEGIRSMKGTVTINGRQTQVNAPVAPGDTIATGPGSEAVFVMQRSAFMLREKSTVTVEGASAIESVKVLAGGILSVFDKGHRNMSTPNAIVGVRGTGLYIEIMEGATYLCTCYGTVEVESLAAPGVRETLVSKHHESARYIFESCAGKPFLPAPMLNHTDKELILIESLVGRTPPFEEGEYEGGGVR